GLEVTLLPIGAQSPMQTVVAGGADFGTTWITDLLTAREQGLPVVHLAQMFQRSGYTMVSLKSTGLKSVCDLKGKKVGVWPAVNNYPAAPLSHKVALPPPLAPKVSNPYTTTVPYPFDPALVFPDKVDFVAPMTYNEVDQIVALGYDLNQIQVWSLAD